MTDEQAIDFILKELAFARRKHPKFPEDRIHQAAIVGEEAGELLRAALQAQYEDGHPNACAEEAVQVGAMAVRFLTGR